MQKPTDLAAVVLNLTPIDFDGNLAKIENVLDQRNRYFSPERIPLFLFPELTVTGHCADFTRVPWVREKALAALESLRPKLNGLYAVFGIPSKSGTNEPILYADGVFQPLSTGTVWNLGGLNLVFLAPDAPIFPFMRRETGSACSSENPGPAVPAAEEADLIFSPTAQVFTFGAQDQFEEMAKRLTGRREVIFAAADYRGNEAGTDIYGGSALFARNGRILARSERFSYAEESILPFPLDAEIIAPAAYAPWEKEEPRTFEEFPRAVAAGLFDYLRKSRSGGFVLSLSGGADSAAIAVIIRLMVLFGCQSIGTTEFLKKIDYIPAVRPLAESAHAGKEVPQKRIAAALLTTVYQATAHSGDVTRTAAEQVARAVGSTHYYFNIAPIVEMYKSMISEATGQKLSWETDDLALQNIQARTRAPGVWLLANRTNSLLLSTGNRSEASVGYMTMDGDSCGSLSPISGVSKAFLRRWLHWMETAGVLFGKKDAEKKGEKRDERFPVPELSYINAQQPTAELRPPEAGQTDEADLMPYTVLDIIEKGAAVEKRTGPALFDFVREKLAQEPEFADASDEQISAWIAKFGRHFSHTAWKRRRSAPGFRLDAYTLAPGGGNDLPLLSGNLPLTEGIERKTNPNG